jgi:hypothetical protein
MKPTEKKQFVNEWVTYLNDIVRLTDTPNYFTRQAIRKHIDSLKNLALVVADEKEQYEREQELLNIYSKEQYEREQEEQK